ncbi:MAG: 1-acyl-sn-glycerol-3-phosphate acyltransferase [Treponema sp.]|nr:1-acyl-sn-glycerol-3-phosphate acyltransferase [Treponema sp.]
MTSFITLCCLFGMVIPPAIFNTLAYPVSKKLSMRISNYIVKTLAPRLFSILACFKHFRFIGYKDNFAMLPSQYIILSNHQSILDIPLFMRFLRNRDLRFVAKAELSRHVPLVSEMLRTQEHCFISRRAKPVTTMRTIEKFAKRVLERNQIPVLFPEGTRTRDGNVGKFHSAGFRKLAEATKLPVVLCALDGGWQISNVKTIMTRLTNGTYRVKVMKIYESPQTKEAEAAILREAPRIIQAQLNAWRKEK